jgi:hypothetical protein
LELPIFKPVRLLRMQADPWIAQMAAPQDAAAASRMHEIMILHI